jgi:hypothetical protein
MEDYLKGCRFLPKLNNEIPGERNATYKERFSSLENLVLIMVRLSRILLSSVPYMGRIHHYLLYGTETLK